MFVYSLKASRIKLLGLSLLCAVVLGSALAYLFHGGSAPELSLAAAQGREIRFDGIKTDEDLYRFVQSLGIEIKTPAYNKAEVDLPRVFDAVYNKYNAIQKQQGFDLTKYCGKTLRRYTFEVTNYPLAQHGINDGAKVYLTVFVHKSKFVGGDISCREGGGLVTTFVDFIPTEKL